MAIVDVHCHTFNADDLPVKGFVRKVVGSKVAIAAAADWVVDRAVQSLARGADELVELDERLAAGPDAAPAVDGAVPAQRIDAEGERALAALETEQPALAGAALAEAQVEAQADAVEHPVDGPAVDGFEDPRKLLKRYLAWAGLFGRSRWDLTSTLMALYPEIELFTTLLVDFQGLADAPATATLDQLAMQERISRLTLLGHTPAVVLPFVGFDPRRNGALALAREAVDQHGAVGVKMYPPMGFRPIGNQAQPPHGMGRDDAFAVDHNLERLYDWCAETGLPITVHCNPSNYAHPAYRSLSAPWEWEAVLDRWPELHLNLGHSGWGAWKERWPQHIARLATPEHPNLYADIGNHSLDELPETLSRLATLLADDAAPEFGSRCMFGTDWFMLASSRGFADYPQVVRDGFAAAFPQHEASFMGDAALRFLGFNDLDAPNARRLRARCNDIGAPVPSWLGAMT